MRNKIALKIVAILFISLMLVSGATPCIAFDNHSTNNASNQLDNTFSSESITTNDTPFPLSSNTIYVPDDYTKIQLAVDNASAGDTIIVHNGSYSEDMDAIAPTSTPIPSYVDDNRVTDCAITKQKAMQKSFYYAPENSQVHSTKLIPYFKCEESKWTKAWITTFIDNSGIIPVKSGFVILDVKTGAVLNIQQLVKITENQFYLSETRVLKEKKKLEESTFKTMLNIKDVLEIARENVAKESNVFVTLLTIHKNHLCYVVNTQYKNGSHESVGKLYIDADTGEIVDRYESVPVMKNGNEKEIKKQENEYPQVMSGSEGRSAFIVGIHDLADWRDMLVISVIPAAHFVNEGKPVVLLAEDDNRTALLDTSVNDFINMYTPADIYLVGDTNIDQIVPGTTHIIDGADLNNISASIALNFWNNSNDVVIATDDDYTSALLAANLATHLQSPLLYVTPTDVPIETQNAISILGVADAFLIGNIPSSVTSQIKALGINTSSLSNTEEVANYINSSLDKDINYVVLSNPYDRESLIRNGAVAKSKQLSQLIPPTEEFLTQSEGGIQVIITVKDENNSPLQGACVLAYSENTKETLYFGDTDLNGEVTGSLNSGIYSFFVAKGEEGTGYYLMLENQNVDPMNYLFEISAVGARVLNISVKDINSTPLSGATIHLIESNRAFNSAFYALFVGNTEDMGRISVHVMSDQHYNVIVTNNSSPGYILIERNASEPIDITPTTDTVGKIVLHGYDASYDPVAETNIGAWPINVSFAWYYAKSPVHITPSTQEYPYIMYPSMRIGSDWYSLRHKEVNVSSGSTLDWSIGGPLSLESYIDQKKSKISVYFKVRDSNGNYLWGGGKSPHLIVRDPDDIVIVDQHLSLDQLYWGYDFNVVKGGLYEYTITYDSASYSGVLTERGTFIVGALSPKLSLLSPVLAAYHEGILYPKSYEVVKFRFQTTGKTTERPTGVSEGATKKYYSVDYTGATPPKASGATWTVYPVNGRYFYGDLRDIERSFWAQHRFFLASSYADSSSYNLLLIDLDNSNDYSDDEVFAVEDIFYNQYGDVFLIQNINGDGDPGTEDEYVGVKCITWLTGIMDIDGFTYNFTIASTSIPGYFNELNIDLNNNGNYDDSGEGPFLTGDSPVINEEQYALAIECSEVSFDLTSPDAKFISEELKNFYFSLNTPPEYLALVGGYDAVPFGIYEFPHQDFPISDDVVSDTVYGNIDDDPFIDISVGRVISSDLYKESALVSRTITYTDLFDSWQDRGLTLSNQGNPAGGLVGIEASAKQAQDHLENIGFTVTGLYENYAWNDFYLLDKGVIMHGDHGWCGGWCGGPNAGGSWTMNSPAIALSEGCSAGSIDECELSNSMAIAFLDRGGIAYIGNTRLSYSIVEEYMVGAFWDGLVYKNMTMGQAMLYAENYMVYKIQKLWQQGWNPSGDQLIFLEQILYGDPAFEPNRPSTPSIAPVRLNISEEIADVLDVEVFGPEQWWTDVVRNDLAEEFYTVTGPGTLYSFYGLTDVLIECLVPSGVNIRVTEETALPHPLGWEGYYFIDENVKGQSNVIWTSYLVQYDNRAGDVQQGADYVKYRVYSSTPTNGSVFDTGPGAYPSIFGTHNGTIKPNHTVIATKLYTHPCPGTGGHTEYAEIGNLTWNATATWKGYVEDWHNITFDRTVVLLADETYNYTIRTGSYPQIIHEQNYTTLDGSFINCTEFTDVNGKSYNNWIPAIRLWA
jgi:hypothetical protein